MTLPKDVVEGSPYSWMPDNKHIVFGAPQGSRKGHLRLIGINDGTSRLLITGYTASAMYPSVSPDGLRITFTTHQGNSDLMEIPLDGSLSRVISTDARSPTWSPSGTQYAFAGENSVDGIWLTSISDHWTHPIVTVRELKAETFDSPSISPDGQRVAYQINSGEIWVSPVSGGTPVRLVSPEWTAEKKTIKARSHKESLIKNSS